MRSRRRRGVTTPTSGGSSAPSSPSLVALDSIPNRWQEMTNIRLHVLVELEAARMNMALLRSVAYKHNDADAMLAIERICEAIYKEQIALREQKVSSESRE